MPSPGTKPQVPARVFNSISAIQHLHSQSHPFLLSLILPFQFAPMADFEDSQPQQQQHSAPSQQDNISQKLETTTFPHPSASGRPRSALTTRSSTDSSRPCPSVLSKRYGSIPQEEASATTRAIKEEAYAAATVSDAGPGGESVAVAASIDEGIEILQIYSKEISKRMLDAVKSKASYREKMGRSSTLP